MGKKSSTQINLEYAAARGAFLLLGLLPRNVAIFVCQGLMHLLKQVAGGIRKTGMRNLELAFPEKMLGERKIILDGLFSSLGRVLGDLTQIHKYDAEKLAALIDFEFDEETQALYERIRKEGRGLLITTGHLGNWEMLVLGFAALHEPISYLARPLDNPKIEAMLSNIRTTFGNNPIGKTHSAMTAIKILNEGGILGILSDVNAHPKEGVFVPFFGTMACTPAGAATIALRSNALIYPTFCVWEKSIDRYKFVHGKLLEPVRTGDRKRDVIETTAAFTAEIEAVIRRYPDQWMWTHKRWKTRPSGETKIYGNNK